MIVSEIRYILGVYLSNNFLLIYMNPTWLVFIGGAISLLGAFLSSQQQNQEISLLASKNEEIATLQKELREALTGENSYIYLNYFSENGLARFKISHVGNFPVYDIFICIKKLRGDEKEIHPIADDCIEINSITKDSTLFLTVHNPAHNQIEEYGIDINTRAGNYFQLLQVYTVNSSLPQAFKLFKRQSNSLELVQEVVDENFPRTLDNNIQWPNIKIGNDGKMSIGLSEHKFK